MADWTYLPVWSYLIERRGPKTLSVRLEDEKQIVRRKSSAVSRTYREKYEGLTRAEMQAQLVFYETKGTDVAFTKALYDPKEATDATEGSVRFTGPAVVEWNGVDAYDVTWEFEDAL